MIVLNAGLLALLVCMPALVGAAIRHVPRWWAAMTDRRAPLPQPYGPPIERLAADLRRLLRLHGELAESAHSALCAHRLWAVEAAIGMRAVEAAAALGVPHPYPAEAATLTRTQLSALLTSLATAGLVLPGLAGRFTTDGRF